MDEILNFPAKHPLGFGITTLLLVISGAMAWYFKAKKERQIRIQHRGLVIESEHPEEFRFWMACFGVVIWSLIALLAIFGYFFIRN